MSSAAFFKRGIAILAVWQSLVDLSLATGLATVTPCPDCRPSIAPKPVIVTAQYQTVSTCTPSPTTILYPYTKAYTTGTSSTVKTVASCSPYAWVSTTIPVYHNETRTSSVVTTTDQPVTFNSQHYTETRFSTVTLPPVYYTSNGTYVRNVTHETTTVKVYYTTIDVKNYCDYNSLGPIAIPGYKGSGLCTDCGPDERSALTQRLTVVSCANERCTSFNETWISSPKTYSSEGQVYTTATTNTYCPTATPETAMPGYTPPAPTGPSSSKPSPPGPTPPAYDNQPEGDKPSGDQPEGYKPKPGEDHPDQPEGYKPRPGEDHPDQPEGYKPKPGEDPDRPEGYKPKPGEDPDTPTDPNDEDPKDEDNPSPDPYDDGPVPNPSVDVHYDQPAPTPYHPGPPTYKVYKREGLEQPRGHVMKRSGLLFWGK